MCDDFDIDKLLEEKLYDDKKNNECEEATVPPNPLEDSRRKSPVKHKSSRRSSSRDRERSHKRRSSRSHRKHSRERRRSRERRHSRERLHSKERKKQKEVRDPKKSPTPEPTPEERDSRTVFCMQLGPRVRERDIEDFFYEAGKTRDLKIITDSKTRRSKGVAYVEFCTLEGADNAVKMSGRKLCGRPVIVQFSQAEKNKPHSALHAVSFSLINKGPMKLYISNLHQNVTCEMLEAVFSKYGPISDLKIVTDHYTKKSMGYGYVTFSNGDDARTVVDHLNGYDLGGKKLRLSHVGENLSHDLDDRGGVDLGRMGKMTLMQNLAEGTGMNSSTAPRMAQSSNYTNQGERIDTPCLILMGVFDATKETQSNWSDDIRDDIIDEADKHGGCVHMFIDVSGGNVYLKCPSVGTAISLAKGLHGRIYGGRTIEAHFIPQSSYHTLFPEAIPLRIKLKMSSTYEAGSFRVGNLNVTV